MAGGCPNDPAKVMQNLKCVIEALKKTFSCPPACPGECCKGPAPPFPPKEPMLLVEDTSLKPINILLDPKSAAYQRPKNTSKESLSMSNKKRSKDGRYVKAYRPKIYRLESCKGSQSVCCLQRLSETELRGGNFVKCVCKKHYGLQDLCERTGCQGSPYCVSNPPCCGPSYFTKTYIGKPTSKPRYYQIVRQKISDLNRRRYMKLVRVPSENCFEATVESTALVQPQFEDTGESAALINPQFEDTEESKALVQPQFEDTGESKALIKPKMYALISLSSGSDGADTARSNPESINTQTSKPHHHHHRKFICKYCNKENEVSSSSTKESSLDSNGSVSQINIESRRYTSKVDISMQSDIETRVRFSKKQNTTNGIPSEPNKSDARQSTQTIGTQIEPRNSSVSKQSTQTIERRMVPHNSVVSKRSTQTIERQIEPRNSSVSKQSTNSIDRQIKPRKQSTQTIERYSEPRKYSGPKQATQTIEELFGKKMSTQTIEATAQQKKMLQLITVDSGTRKSKTKYTKLEKKRAAILGSDLSTSDLSSPEYKESSHSVASTPKHPSQVNTSAQTECPCIQLRQFCKCNMPALTVDQKDSRYMHEVASEREESSPHSSSGSLELSLTEHSGNNPSNTIQAIEDVKNNKERSTKSFYALNVSVSKSKHLLDLEPASDKEDSSVPNNTPILGGEDSSEASTDSPFSQFYEPNFVNSLEFPTITENPYIKMPFRPNLTTILDSEDVSGNKECQCCHKVLKVDDSSSARDDIDVIKKNSAFVESDVCTSAAVTDLSSSGLSVQYEFDIPSNANKATKRKNCAAKLKKKVRFNSCPDLCCDDQ
ncbi:unnamed protein product [Psylliodes chrysocephalus]|uniref:Uncharacterized protein n=1 Tax=Psylliodes chrysocephalus TaxID=3402493 RepID=A0A9P0GJA2_9CUCU|nr:unnamed protein product [Psylliodes chrysocephala]